MRALSRSVSGSYAATSMSREPPPHRLHPLVGLHLGRARVTPNDLTAASLAAPVWGPGALLADLELRTARPARSEDPLARLSAYREALTKIDVGVFAQSLRVDPWGTTYVYVKHDDGTWLLSSLGADQAVGGEGENADLDVRSK